MFCAFFCWIFENNCPGGGVLARFFLPQGSELRTFLVPEGLGIRPFEKIPWGDGLGGWSGLELTDT